jgi:hypothetical protein
VTIGVNGTTTVCPSATGGTVTAVDVDGGIRAHEWGYRTVSMGTSTPIPGQANTSYLINGADFGMPSGSPGTYFLVCTTTPECGAPITSNEIQVTVTADPIPPAVTPPPALTTPQTLCM